MEVNTEGFMTVREAASYLGYAVPTLYTKVQNDGIPHKRIGRSVRFRRSELDQWVEEQTAAARSGGQSAS